MNRSNTRPLGNLAKEEILLISVLGVLFVTFVVMIVFLIASERNKNTLLAEYEADRAASGLLETYREEIYNPERGGTAQESQIVGTLPGGIVGFGVYSRNGEAFRTLGEAPSSIAALIPQIEPRLFRFNPRTGTIDLLRLLGAIPGEPGQQARFRGQDQRGRMFGMMGQAGQPFPVPEGPPRPAGPAYVYVKLSTHTFFANRNLLTLALILVPIALGVAMAVVWVFYARNRRYRAKIESQEHLVHLGEIARTLSHEIKNPLSSIRLQTGIMRRVHAAESPRELTLIEEETDRITQLVERIGEFLRDPIGNPEEIEISGFLKDLVSRFEWKIEGFESPDEAVYVSFDRNRLRTVLENLLKNAAESGGEATPFSIQILPTRQRVDIRIVDHGVGISPELQEKMFDPFYTTKVKGSGIGLAISKRFVESLGGTLRLENVREGGTEARVTLKRILTEPAGKGGE
jgi:two-component system sensor histidine kinase HydH